MPFKVRIPVDIVVTYGADVDVILSHDEYQEYIQGKDIKEIVTAKDVKDLYDKYVVGSQEFMEEDFRILWDESMPE